MRPLFLAAALFVAAQAQAQTAWPAGMERYARGWAESAVAAQLPQPVSIVPPEAGLSPAKQRFSGVWQGWACANAFCEVKVAVERVTENSATVAYAGANQAQGLITDRTEAEFAGDELHARLRTGARLVLRMRADGDLEMSLWRPETTLLSVGVLSQQPPGYVRSVERVPTPWTHEGAPVTLEMVVYRPPGPGPFPTIIVNHGSTGEGNRPEWFVHTWAGTDVGKYFVRQGWQAVFPQRRGRGKSGGLYDEGFESDRSRYACRPELSLPGLDRAMEDLDAVMAHLHGRPDVDTSRMLISGVSRGGILSVAYAGRRPDAFRGVINFVGGWLGDRCPGSAEVNPTGFKRGAGFGKPMLWLYGDGDPFYSLRHSRGNHEAFAAAGGKARFVAFEKIPLGNGHSVHLNPVLWEPEVDAYLKEIGLTGL